MCSFILEKRQRKLFVSDFKDHHLDTEHSDRMFKIKLKLPLTVSLVEHSALPKEFSATILYSPVSLGPTLNMSREQTPQVLEIK